MLSCACRAYDYFSTRTYVGKFTANRLTITSIQGDTMIVDPKEGTVIRPTGSTPTAGQRVAIFGYWSNGTFIANRVILHG